jgi:hypothetical protein
MGLRWSEGHGHWQGMSGKMAKSEGNVITLDQRCSTRGSAPRRALFPAECALHAAAGVHPNRGIACKLGRSVGENAPAGDAQGRPDEPNYTYIEPLLDN